MFRSTRLFAALADAALLAGCQQGGSTAANGAKSSIGKSGGTTAATPATAADSGAAAKPVVLPGESIDGIAERSKDGLKIYDLVVGTGTESVEGKAVQLHYTGYLITGERFDSSHDRNEPLAFTPPAVNIIKGMNLGVLGMKVGGKRKVVIPPDLGYGARGYPGVIPPNSTLVFDMELINVQ